MHEADLSRAVNQHLRGQTAKFEKFHFLTVKFQNTVIRIGQTDKWQIVLFPIVPKDFGFFRSRDQNVRVQFQKSVVIPAQLRHVRAAERSQKPPVKNDQNIFLSGVILQGHAFAVKIVQREVGRLCVEFDSGHLKTSLRILNEFQHSQSIISTTFSWFFFFVLFRQSDNVLK